MVKLQGGHQVQLLFRGEEFFSALIDAVNAAVSEVRLETYIFYDDAIGQQVLAALVAAANRGVAVYLLVDGIGTPELPPAWVTQLQQSGVQWRQFAPLGRLGLLIPGRWRRLHRKLCVVDRRLAFCGGINILDDLLQPEQGLQTTPRFDFAVQVQGPLVADAWSAMEQIWWRMQVARQVQQGQFEKLRHSLAEPGKSKQHSAARQMHTAPAGTVRAALLLRDNVYHRRRIEQAYRRAIAQARDEVLIANAYFLPGRKLRLALVRAVQRGVKVRLLLQGRYEYFMQFHAAKPFYGALLEAGVEIHEYQAGFLHAKVAVVDGLWATVGSSNLDPLSLLLAREANVVLEDATLAGQLRSRLDAAIRQDSVQLDPARFANRPWAQRLKDRLAYSLMRLTLLLVAWDY